MNITVEDDSEVDPYDITSVIKNNRIPLYSKLNIVDWNAARFYSIIDLEEHPLKELAIQKLTNHLINLRNKNTQAAN